MLESFQMSSESEVQVAHYSPLPREPEFQAFQEVTPGGQFGSAGASPSLLSRNGAPHAEREGYSKRTRRAWAPNADDHLIYRMVKLDGSGQEFVAECFGVSQSTVSRIVRRYERWEAHAAAREDGRLDPAERLRSQRWLAFERNEAMLTSCLRLAGEMERCKELSKSVTRYPLRKPNQETEVRNESAVLDRTGMAARFLRLAFRINMEQVKLAEAEPAPLPEPLTEEEVAQQEEQDAEDRAEIAAVRERSNQNIEEERRSIMDELQAARYQAEQARRDAAAAREEAAAARQEADSARREADEARLLAPGPRPLSPGSQEPGDREQETGDRSEDAAIVLHKMHNLHTPGDAKPDASAVAAGTCAALRAEDNFFGAGLHSPASSGSREPATSAAGRKAAYPARKPPT